VGYRRRERSGAQREVTPHSFSPASAPHGTERRSETLFRCGVFLLCLSSCWACVAKDPAQSVAAATPLVIGVSEAQGEQSEFGIPQIVEQITTETLTTTGIDGRAQPRLATKWRWEEDERQLRLMLRDDVLLHDGTRFDSQIAAEALAKAISRASNRAQYPALTDVSAALPEGQFELVLRLARRSALLPENLTVLLDLPAGPYRPINSAANTAELERFNSYFLGAPSIERMTLRSFDTLRTAWARLLRGELDMVYDVPADAIEFIRSDDVQVFSVPRWYQLLILFNMRRPPLDSEVVRRALNVAVNRQTLLDEVLQGKGAASTGPIWPRYWAYDNSVPRFPFDPQQAESLLAQAGFRDSRANTTSTRPPARFRFVTLIPENFSVWERIALHVQRDLFEVGVDMQFKVVPFPEFNKLIGAGDFDAVLLDLISGPTPERPFLFWRSARAFRGPYNVFGYENQDAETTFDVIRTSTNEAAVRSATSRLQRAMADDPPALFLAWTERARAIRRDIVVPQSDRPDVMWTLANWMRRPTTAPAAE
jgi:peptide/nickel transport system substrate-binding protein